jgi:hypothetical protein
MKLNRLNIMNIMIPDTHIIMITYLNYKRVRDGIGEQVHQ